MRFCTRAFPCKQGGYLTLFFRNVSQHFGSTVQCRNDSEGTVSVALCKGCDSSVVYNDCAETGGFPPPKVPCGDRLRTRFKKSSCRCDLRDAPRVLRRIQAECPGRPFWPQIYHLLIGIRIMREHGWRWLSLVRRQTANLVSYGPGGSNPPLHAMKFLRNPQRPGLIAPSATPITLKFLL